MIFSISPRHEWQVGDKAYCIKGSTRTQPTLEAGKIYVVSKVIFMEGRADDGIGLEGVHLPDGREGCLANRFIRLRRGQRPAQEISIMSARTWIEAYRASVGQVPHPYDL